MKKAQANAENWRHIIVILQLTAQSVVGFAQDMARPYDQVMPEMGARSMLPGRGGMGGMARMGGVGGMGGMEDMRNMDLEDEDMFPTGIGEVGMGSDNFGMNPRPMGGIGGAFRMMGGVGPGDVNDLGAVNDPREFPREVLGGMNNKRRGVGNGEFSRMGGRGRYSAEWNSLGGVRGRENFNDMGNQFGARGGWAGVRGMGRHGMGSDGGGRGTPIMEFPGDEGDRSTPLELPGPSGPMGLMGGREGVEGEGGFGNEMGVPGRGARRGVLEVPDNLGNQLPSLGIGGRSMDGGRLMFGGMENKAGQEEPALRSFHRIRLPLRDIEDRGFRMPPSTVKEKGNRAVFQPASNFCRKGSCREVDLYRRAVCKPATLQCTIMYCHYDYHCGVDASRQQMKCVQNLCVELNSPCRGSQACHLNSVCSPAGCHPLPCRSRGDCQKDMTCRAGYCIKNRCRADLECSLGSFCSYGRCIDCQCGRNQGCVKGCCSSVLPPKRRCPCRGNSVCQSGECVDKCSVSRRCPKNYFCNKWGRCEICYKSCSSAEGCRDTYSPNKNYCGNSNYYCPKDYTCMGTRCIIYHCGRYNNFRCPFSYSCHGNGVCKKEMTFG